MFWRSVKPLPRYGDFLIFKMASVGHFLFSKFKILMVDYVERVNMRHLPNFVEIARTVAKILRFNCFQNGGPPLCWFLNIRNFNV